MNYQLEYILKYFEAYKAYYDFTSKSNDRKPNFPEGLSERIAVYALNKVYYNKYSRADKSKKEVGDVIDIYGNQIEVKASILEEDCSSFGPQEYFDNLIFIKIDIDKKHIEVYDCHINSFQIRNIKVTKTGTTFGEQADNGRRPRFCISKKIPNKELIYQFDL